MIWDGSRPSKHPSILLIPSNKLAASAVHPVPWGIWKGDPGDLSRGIRVLQSLEAAAVPSCFSLSLSVQLSFGGAGGTGNSSRCHSLFFIYPGLALAQSRATGSAGISNLGISATAACGDGDRGCVGFSLPAISCQARNSFP